MPVKGDLGLRVGPFKGAALSVQLSYAAANDWLMPAMADGQLLFGYRNLRAWKAGVHASWSFRKCVLLDAGFETSLGDGEKDCWIEWRDRARHVVSASLRVTPIPALSVDLSYELRMKRRMAVADGTRGFVETSLCDVNNLNAGASYRVTDAFTVFARAENLLGKTHYIMPFVPEQGFTGLVGVGLKF